MIYEFNYSCIDIYKYTRICKNKEILKVNMNIDIDVTEYKYRCN